MDNTLFTAIIAFIGVVISALITMVINNRNNKINIEKTNRDVEQDYARELLKKRIELYPIMYEELSNFIKSTQLGGKVTKEQFIEFFKKTNSLNSKISIFYSGETGKISYTLWKYIKSKVEEIEQRDHIDDPEELREIRKEIQKLEIRLKSDIGVFIVEFNDGEKKIKFMPNYEEISNKVKEGNINTK